MVAKKQVNVPLFFVIFCACCLYLSSKNVVISDRHVAFVVIGNRVVNIRLVVLWFSSCLLSLVAGKLTLLTVVRLSFSSRS